MKEATKLATREVSDTVIIKIEGGRCRIYAGSEYVTIQSTCTISYTPGIWALVPGLTDGTIYGRMHFIVRFLWGGPTLGILCFYGNI